MSEWLSVEQIRKQQRMRRIRVIEAMDAGELPFEKRGRIRWARLRDVVAWEEARLSKGATEKTSRVHPDLTEFL